MTGKWFWGSMFISNWAFSRFLSKVSALPMLNHRERYNSVRFQIKKYAFVRFRFHQNTDNYTQNRGIVSVLFSLFHQHKVLLIRKYWRLLGSINGLENHQMIIDVSYYRTRIIWISKVEVFHTLATWSAAYFILRLIEWCKQFQHAFNKFQCSRK